MTPSPCSTAKTPQRDGGISFADLTRSRLPRRTWTCKRAAPESSPRRSLSDLFERGWVHGSDTFREIVLDVFGPAETKEPSASANSNYRSSELGKAFAEAEAGRILADGLKHFDLDEASLQKTAKGDWRKVAIARTISERTTVRQEWIAERLNLKSASNVSQRVRQYRLRSDNIKVLRDGKTKIPFSERTGQAPDGDISSTMHSADFGC